jgi:hypothetical protein
MKYNIKNVNGIKLAKVFAFGMEWTIRMPVGQAKTRILFLLWLSLIRPLNFFKQPFSG